MALMLAGRAAGVGFCAGRQLIKKAGTMEETARIDRRPRRSFICSPRYTDAGGHCAWLAASGTIVSLGEWLINFRESDFGRSEMPIQGRGLRRMLRYSIFMGGPT